VRQRAASRVVGAALAFALLVGACTGRGPPASTTPTGPGEPWRGGTLRMLGALWPVSIIDSPTGIVVAPSGVWVTSGLDGVVVRIDPTTDTVTDRLRVRVVADALAVGEDGAIWVTVQAR
jgi:streptogramin lyase